MAEEWARQDRWRPSTVGAPVVVLPTNPAYSVAWRWAAWRRRRYAASLARVAGEPVSGGGEGVAAELYYFSGTRDLPEQVASLRSFFQHVGMPRRVVVVGDGTHGEDQRRLLMSLGPRVEVHAWDGFVRRDLPEVVRSYAAAHPLGKKIAVLLSMEVRGSVIFSDSDILYFPGGGELRERVGREGPGVEFLMDSYPSLDPRLVGEGEKHPPVNSGFAILRRPLEWGEALGRWSRVAGEAGHFTEQTIFHLAVRSTGGGALPRGLYVFQSDDQFSARDWHVGPGVVLRHYFSSLRYKMWLKVRASR